MFSFYLTGHEEESYVDFGDYDRNVMKNEEEIVWLDVIDNDRWWTNFITGFKWDLPEPVLYNFEKTKAFTDTGTSCIIGPKDYVNWITQTLVNSLSSS